MGRREPCTDPADLPPPALIAREIVRGLREAERQMQAILHSLEGSTPERPEPEQLTFPAA